jgi:octopine/nopaline transport system permease protein
MDYNTMQESILPLLSAIPNTLLLTFSSVLLGFFIAVPLALGRLSTNKFIAKPCYAYVYFLRSTPLLVQIFLIYYGSGQFVDILEAVGLWQYFREPWFCAILALCLNTAAYVCEIIRGGIMSVPKGQWEASHALGLNKVDTFTRVIFPQAFRQALPAYGNEIIIMVKASSLASTITILEITGVAEKLISETFQPLEIFIVAGSIYLSLNFIIAQVIHLLENRLNRHLAHGATASK